MKRFQSVTEYLDHHHQYSELLFILRDILLKCGLDEVIKWGAPCYTFNGKNVIAIGAFKSYVGLWFYQGSLLKDDHNVLINAQEGVTHALRQWRFKRTDELDPNLIKSYILEAIENERKGIKVQKSIKKTIDIPVELSTKFETDHALKEAFDKFSPYKQKEFIEYLSQAKREATRQNRLNKILPLILSGSGLNDKYRK